MEELLPLIIGILWLVYTFYSRGQKKRSAKQPAGTERREKKDPTFLEQLLAAEGIQLGEEEPLIQEEEIPYTDQPVASAPVKKTTPFLNSELQDYVEEGQPQFYNRIRDHKEKGRRYPITFEEDDVFIVRDREQVDFNLRDAVVYSAILNAPYINYK